MTLKLKTHDFKSFTRRVSLNEAGATGAGDIQCREADVRRAKPWDSAIACWVSVAGLVDAKADAMDLADPKALKRARPSGPRTRRARSSAATQS